MLDHDATSDLHQNESLAREPTDIRQLFCRYLPVTALHTTVSWLSRKCGYDIDAYGLAR